MDRCWEDGATRPEGRCVPAGDIVPVRLIHLLYGALLSSSQLNSTSNLVQYLIKSVSYNSDRVCPCYECEVAGDRSDFSAGSMRQHLAQETWIAPIGSEELRVRSPLTLAGREQPERWRSVTRVFKHHVNVS